MRARSAIWLTNPQITLLKIELISLAFSSEMRVNSSKVQAVIMRSFKRKRTPSSILASNLFSLQKRVT
jgi:hypothetical protein